MDSNTVKKLDYILSGYKVTYEEKQEIIELMQEYHQEQLKLYSVMQAEPEKVLNNYPYERQLKRIDQLNQTQISLKDQLELLRPFANKLGLYDAADYIKD